jgi:hypothetical protein
MEVYMRSLTGLLHNVCITLLFESYIFGENLPAAGKKENLKGVTLWEKE